MSEWAETFRAIKYLFFVFTFVMINGMWIMNYYIYTQLDDDKYLLKKQFWLDIKNKYIYTSNNKVLILKDEWVKPVSTWATLTWYIQPTTWIIDTASWKINTESSKIDSSNLMVMERFPILTYYTWSKQRWLTPYTKKLEDLVEYARYNRIDYLVVDTMDFQKYRPELMFLLDYKKNHRWLEFVRKISIPWNTVIIYRFKTWISIKRS
jgi:hypothetical protein